VEEERREGGGGATQELPGRDSLTLTGVNKGQEGKILQWGKEAAERKKRKQAAVREEKTVDGAAVRSADK